VFQEYEVDNCEQDDDGDIHDQACHEMLSEEQDIYANNADDHEQEENQHVYVLGHGNTPFKLVSTSYMLINPLNKDSSPSAGA
jgi:hypothetical protein